MASYRPFPPPGQARGSQYTQSWGYNGVPESNYPPPQFAPPPPPPDSAYPPPPPPSVPSQSGPASSIYYPSSQQYSQYSQNHNPPMQPPPPPSPPPSSSLPPPPPPPPASPPLPPSSAPPVQSKESSRHKDGKDSGQPNQFNSSRHRKPPVASVPEKKTHGHPERGVETEEERRLRKKKEYEKQRQEEKHRQQVKESQNRILQKTQVLSSGIKGHGSITGSHIGERRTTPLLTGERAENRLKKPTTFLCKLK